MRKYTHIHINRHSHTHTYTHTFDGLEGLPEQGPALEEGFLEDGLIVEVEDVKGIQNDLHLCVCVCVSVCEYFDRGEKLCTCTHIYT